MCIQILGALGFFNYSCLSRKEGRRKGRMEDVRGHSPLGSALGIWLYNTDMVPTLLVSYIHKRTKQ